MGQIPLIAKLSSFIDLSADEGAELASWCVDPIAMRAGDVLIREGDRPARTCIMLEGWAGRYKLLRDGNKSCVGFLLPGDVCDLHQFLLKSVDHSIEMFSNAKLALVAGDVIASSLMRQPRLMQAFWWSTLVDEGIVRAWLTNVGRRDAQRRLSHLFCELWTRASRVGLTVGSELKVPLSQAELAEAIGLTPVHVNRTLRSLREQGLLTFKGDTLAIPNLARLAEFAEFDPNYLQLDRRM